MGKLASYGAEKANGGPTRRIDSAAMHSDPRIHERLMMRTRSDPEQQGGPVLVRSYRKQQGGPVKFLWRILETQGPCPPVPNMIPRHGAV